MNRVPDIDSRAVLAFWFGADAKPESVSDTKQGMWFRNGADHDAEIRQRFGTYLDAAAAGAFDAWCAEPRGRLALLVLLDQMPRHVHRGSARAFAADAKAREICLAGLEVADDVRLDPIERVIYYLPLEHAENLTLQTRCVSLYEALAVQVSEAARQRYREYASYARAHRDIIARFGHFPHRSTLIGRPLSAEEAAFLQEPGSSF